VQEITQLLAAARGGDRAAADQVVARLYAELQRTVRGLQLQCDELSKYKQDSLQGASAMNSLVHRADERCLQLEKECAEKVTAAVDLAEKQNTLTMSLEAKVEDTCILVSLVLRV
jgi:hypothetical protein